MSELLGLADAASLKRLVVILVLLVLAAWGGKALGQRYQKSKPSGDEDLKIVLGATLSLFGLLMGFLLSFAISGYNTRLDAEEQEAIALANAYQRMSLLPSDAQRHQVQALLDQYLQARIEFHEGGEPSARTELRMRAIHLQTQIWNVVSEVAKQAPNPLSMSLVQACQELYVTQQQTMSSWRNQIPMVAWTILVVFAICSTFLVGYQMQGSRRGMAWLLVVPVVTAMALFMISEIDVPGEGMIQVTPQNLEGLRHTLDKGGLID